MGCLDICSVRLALPKLSLKPPGSSCAEESATVGICSGSGYCGCAGISRIRKEICLSNRVTGISVFAGA